MAMAGHCVGCRDSEGNTVYLKYQVLSEETNTSHDMSQEELTVFGINKMLKE